MKNLSIEWSTIHIIRFVNTLETLPKEIKKIQLQRNGISKSKYNEWVKTHGVSFLRGPVLDSMKNVDPKSVHFFDNLDGHKTGIPVNITLTVESFDELKSTLIQIQNISNVQNINSAGYELLEDEISGD